MNRLAIAIALTSACVACDQTPVREVPVVLYVQDEADCALLEDVHEAVAELNAVADVGLVVDGCEVADFASVVTTTEGARGLGVAGTEGLDFREGEVPVYFVDEITAHYLDGRVVPNGGIGGKQGCTMAVAFKRPGAALIAHEMTHALGVLAHDDRDGNLMREDVTAGWWMDDAQAETIEATVRECF